MEKSRNATQSIIQMRRYSKGTLHPAQSQGQGNEFPQKESPFLISVALYITSTSPSRTKGSSGPGWQP